MTEPIFKDIFAEQWKSLPPALKAHYANRPFSHDRVTVSGHLTIRFAGVEYVKVAYRLLDPHHLG